MTRRRYRPPFWRRKKPLPQHDITKLLPQNLKRGDRFETIDDVQIESERSELLLKLSGGRKLATSLQDCRENHQQCDQAYCPLCARVFRRWFIGELLRLSEGKPVTMCTVLLEKAGPDRINKLDPKDFRGLLRQRLLRAGLTDAIIIGGFENAYRAREKKWVLHINLVVIGGQVAAMDKFQQSFANSDIERPVVTALLNNPAKQLSYVPKFTTYHRPYEQRASKKGRATPLNAPEHVALVEWMSQRSFKDFMFFLNARQGVDSIVPRQQEGPGR
jgi:hypothetical protein